MEKESDFNFLKKNFEQYPELRDAIFNPLNIIGGSFGKIEEMNKSINGLLLICDNPDIEFSKVPIEINFIDTWQIQNSEEIPEYILYKYINFYENNSEMVNEIIEDTIQNLKKLYNPLKSLHNDIKNYSNNFKTSLDQIRKPLENSKKGLDDINYEKYSKDKQNQFLEDKSEVIKEIDNFIKEANDFYKDYKDLSITIFENINNLVERFNNLALPTKELTTFMRSLMEGFEKSSRILYDFDNNTKINEIIKEIEESINKFFNKSKNIENLLSLIRSVKIERINEMIEISNRMKDKINKLEASSKAISKKIKKIRDKYDEPKVSLSEISIPPAEVINFQKPSSQIEEQGKEIAKTSDKGVKDITGNIDKIKLFRLDLLFIMDITASMDYYLDHFKKIILFIIDGIKKYINRIDIYLGFIGYKDFNDLYLGEEYINLDFTTDYEYIRKSIENVNVGGGGDIPEDLCGALELAKKKYWEGKIRIAILITDSPCHGRKYHDLTGDQEDFYPDGDRDGRNIENYIEFFAKNKISLICLKINDTTDKMFNIFSEVYNKNKGKNSQSKFSIVEGRNYEYNIVEFVIDMCLNREK